MPELYDDARACAEEAIAHVGKKIVLGLPLGLGKANHLANAFYDIAAADQSVSLSIFTGLTLEVPRAAPGLERRFLQPILDRLFEGYVEPKYAAARREGRLPENVTVREFFYPTASLLTNDYAQREYVSANYTHVTRRVLEAGINVLAQMIAQRGNASGTRYSLASNPDLALDVVPGMRRQLLRKVRVLGEVNALLPFMPGDAEVGADWFDSVFQGPPSTLFGTPTNPVSLQDHAIGLNASALIRDGGTLQIGIGSLAEAVAHALLLRQRNNAEWQRLIEVLAGAFTLQQTALALGDRGDFTKGLYACSEMMSDGLLALLEQGVVKREVVDAAGGRVRRRSIDGAFFLGSRGFYQRLRKLDEKLLEQINMTSVERVNGLYGGEDARRAQRRDARLLNAVMEATALGGAASDALSDGRIVSGVGGQYNFVAMGHELEDGRSILLVRATKMRGGHVHSNIVWERPNETIPRHLKDIVVSEYGIADLRGQTDCETAKRMISICDSRFQEALLDQAKRARKIERSYHIPDAQKQNTPGRLAAVLGAAKSSDTLPTFPFGTDLTEIEVVLAGALRHLKAQTASPRALLRFARSVLRVSPPPPSSAPYLERLGLGRAASLKERALQRLVVTALLQTGALD